MVIELNVVFAVNVLTLLAWMPPLKTRSSPGMGATPPDQFNGLVQNGSPGGVILLLAPVHVRVAALALFCSKNRNTTKRRASPCPLIRPLTGYYKPPPTRRP